MLFIGFLALCLLAACNSNMLVPEPVEGPSSALSAIDSLMWQQPDSALACLLPYFDTCCRDAKSCVSTATEYNRHYANLLLSELLYKNYYDQINRAELQQAVVYFDSLVRPTPPFKGAGGIKKDRNSNLVFLDARAHYINGVGYYEQDSVVPACKEYLKALEVMEEHYEEEELVGKKAQFMAYSYTRLTDLFSDLYLHEQAICFAQRSLSYYLKQDTPSWYSARMLYEIGTQYDMLDELDSSDCYYNQAASVLDDTTTLMYRDIVAHQAFLTYRRTHQPEKGLAVLYRLAGMAENNDELLARYLVIGSIYYYEHHLDSAYYYMQTIYENKEDRDLKMLSAEMMQEIALSNGDTFGATEFALTRSNFASLPSQNGGLYSALNNLCQQYEKNKRDTQQKLEARRSIGFWVKAFGTAALIVIIMVLLLVKQNKCLVSEHRLHEVQQAALSKRLKKSHQKLREMESQIKQKSQCSSNSKPIAASFGEEPVCQMILERVNEGHFKSQMDCSAYKAYSLTKGQLSALREATNRHYDHFTERLAQSYPNLTNSDLDYCCLYLLGLTDADIAALMQRAYSTVSDRSRKLKAVFGNNIPLSIALRRIAREETTN